jgi:nanoRNase/pAp phosphatase (c-di-AMP/oligoRNAs hydrolase)
MGRRFKVVSATVLGIIGVAVIAVPLIGGGQLHAAGLQATGVDFSRILIWAGVVILGASSLLFVASNAD